MLAIRTRPSSGDGNDTRGNSKQAFAQMNRAGHAVNPLDPRYLRALLYRQMEHLDGDSMVQFLGDRKSKPMKQLGNKKILGFWGVPKTNFDGKPPAHWGECLMNPDKLATLVPMGSPHVNWNDYFVVDKGIPRQGLGSQVLTYVFYDCVNNGKAITATGPEPAVGGSAGPAIGGPEPAIGGSVHPAIDHVEPANGGSVHPVIGGPEPARRGSVHPAIGHVEPANGGSVHPAIGGPEPAIGGPWPARRGPGPARGGPGPAGGGPPRAFEGEVPQLFAWGRLADELLWRSHRRSFLCWLRLALQHLIWSTQRTALQEMLNLQFQ